jgi:hypothetical protein
LTAGAGRGGGCTCGGSFGYRGPNLRDILYSRPSYTVPVLPWIVPSHSNKLSSLGNAEIPSSPLICIHESALCQTRGESSSVSGQSMQLKRDQDRQYHKRHELLLKPAKTTESKWAMKERKWDGQDLLDTTAEQLTAGEMRRMIVAMDWRRWALTLRHCDSMYDGLWARCWMTKSEVEACAFTDLRLFESGPKARLTDRDAVGWSAGRVAGASEKRLHLQRLFVVVLLLRCVMTRASACNGSAARPRRCLSVFL